RPLLAPTSSSCSPCPSPRSPSLLLNAPPPTAISPLSLHDALPIFARGVQRLAVAPQKQARAAPGVDAMNFVALGERRKAHHLPALLGQHVRRQIVLMQPVHDQDYSAAPFVVLPAVERVVVPFVDPL